MDYIEGIREAVRQGEAADVVNYIHEAILYKYPPEAILENGIIAGIEQVAEKFKKLQLFIPEVLISARAFQIGIKTILPFLPVNQTKNPPKVVIGTVSGDIHDIGKNIIITFLSVEGCQVVDLGVDVSAEQFVEAVRKEKPQMLMLSALLTTTVSYMKEVIERLEKEKLRSKVKIFVGGAPVSREFATEIGADYYTADAFELRETMEKLIASKQL